MKLELDQGLIQKAIGEAVSKGVGSCVGDWQTVNAIAEVAKEELKQVDIPGLVQKELAKRLESEADGIARDVAEFAMPAIREAFKESFEQAMTCMLYGLYKGHPESGYMGDGEKKAWNAARAAMKSATAESRHD